MRERLAGLTSFSAGGDLARALAPSAEADEVARRAAETEEGMWLRDQGVAGPGGASDVRPVAAQAARGAVLEAETLLDVLSTTRIWREEREAVVPHREHAPLMAATVEWPDVGAARRVEAALERAIDPRGGLLDAASADLASIRHRLVTARRAAADLLRELAVRLRPHLQESFTTVRGGRPVLAVKASSRSAVPGVVHDSSGSGETIFVEPMALLEANNRVRDLTAQEHEEEQRILRSLSRMVGEETRLVDDMVGALADLDLALAAASLSRAWNGCPVEPAAEVDLRAARHPLLDPATAVPIDLPLAGTRALVVSGPNTGGKTVALKTLGLFAMLHQCGLRVPAESARMPVFDRVLADIGDDQSIAESLSTFSAHVRRLITVMEVAGPRSLVLLDEPAAGTDPDEGSRLAQAVIERLVDQGALVLATTHHPEVKAWASERPGAANAAVGVDIRTLRPLYELKIGEPGASHALGIAEGLGLDPRVVAAARAAAPPERRALEALLGEAAAARAAADDEREAAREARAAAEQAERVATERTRDLERRIERAREGRRGRAGRRPRPRRGRADGAQPRADPAARRDLGRPPGGVGPGHRVGRRRGRQPPCATARPSSGRRLTGRRARTGGAARARSRRRPRGRRSPGSAGGGRPRARPRDGIPRAHPLHRRGPRRGAGGLRADAPSARPPAARSRGVPPGGVQRGTGRSARGGGSRRPAGLHGDRRPRQPRGRGARHRARAHGRGRGGRHRRGARHPRPRHRGAAQRRPR